MNGRTAGRLTPAQQEDLLEVLLRQYLLHEVDHHPPPGTTPGESGEVLTLAHDMPDIYKCLHQGVFGYWNHIPSPEYLRNHLADDYYGVEANDAGPVLEAVRADESVLRVNLRPLKTLFPGEEDRAFFLLEALVLESSLIEKGHPDELFDALTIFREMNRHGVLTIENRHFVIDPQRAEVFYTELGQLVGREGTLPLFSHSREYHRLNGPSYVIVDLAPLSRSPLGFLLDRPIG